jgi:outer membrane lipoprotein-sorting protein
MDRRTFLLALLASTLPPRALAAEPTVEEILAGIDRNMVFESRTATVSMTVEGSRRTRSFAMLSYGRGKDDSAMEFLSPVREKGTRMLKRKDDLWMYMPTVDKTQKISGHMLRQGMMGSDLSYEDMMASSELRTMYSAKVLGTETVEGRPAWKLEMLAKDESVAYPKRLSWVDTELFIPVKQEIYALSGMLLKTWVMSDIVDVAGRKFPSKMVIRDEVKKESKTTLEFRDLEFGVDLPEEVFGMRWLERK